MTGTYALHVILIHSTEKEEKSIVMTVCDNGPGVPKEIANTLFMPFATYGKKGGTGLGLAITSRSRSYEAARASMTRTMIALVAAFLFVFIFAPIFSARLSASILDPISRITGTFRTLASGGAVSQIAGIDLKDEMGELARAARRAPEKS